MEAKSNVDLNTNSIKSQWITIDIRHAFVPLFREGEIPLQLHNLEGNADIGATWKVWWISLTER